MELTPAQAQITSDLHRFRVLCCGRRFGKTTLAIEEMKARAVARPGRIAYIAPTLQQARDIAWAQLKRDCAQAAISIREAPVHEIRLPTQRGGESLIVLRGWEAVETLRGQQFDLIVIDEVASMRNFDAHWSEIVRPTLTDTRGEALFISTPKGFNHFYKLFSKDPAQPAVTDVKQDSDFKSFHFSSYDNPHMPPDEIEKAERELTEDRFSQEYLALFKKTEGLVYKEFNRDVHLFDEPGFEGERFTVSSIFGGVDPGFHAPCAAITIKEDSDHVFWVTNEWYKTSQTEASQADYISALKWHECYPDPESPSFIEELKRRGVNVRDVIKNSDSIESGINVVRELFKQHRLFIHTSCINLIWELETYSYPEKKPFHNENENPIKENDHAVDALRYALSMRGLQQKKKSMTVHRPPAPSKRRW